MASKLRRKSKTSWEFAVSQGTTIVTDPETGEKRRRPAVQWFTVKAKTRAEADAKRIEILDQLAKGTYVEPSKLTLAEFLLEHFIPHLEAKDRSPATVSGYKLICEVHIIPALGGLRLEQLAPIHVEKWLNTALAAPRGGAHKRKAADRATAKQDPKPKAPLRRPSARTLEYWRAVLHRAMEYAFEMDLIARNPVSKVKPPKVKRGRPDAYSRDEVARILAAAPRYRAGALVVTGLLTGARLGELLALRWSELDFNAGTLTVQRTLVDPGNQQEGREPLFKETTKDDEVRAIPLAPELVPVLRAWRRRWVEERLRAGTGYHNAFALVFPTETGWPQSPSTVNRELGRVLKAAGVRRLSFHKLRHTFATRLLDAGIDIDTVAELLGDDILTVKKFYVGERPEAKKAAVRALGRLLTAGAPAPEAASEQGEREAEALPVS